MHFQFLMLQTFPMLFATVSLAHFTADLLDANLRNRWKDRADLMHQMKRKAMKKASVRNVNSWGTAASKRAAKAGDLDHTKREQAGSFWFYYTFNSLWYF